MINVIINYKYVILFLGVVFEGPVVMVASGFFLHQGFFQFIPMFITLCLGDLVGDVGWYYVGYFFAEPFLRKHGHLFGVTLENFEKVKALFNHYHMKILLISKMTLGFGMSLVTLMVAGATKIPFRMYMLLNIIGEVVLVAILLAIGYFFGHLYNDIAQGFKIAFVIGLAIFVGLVIYGFTKYAKDKILQSKQ